MPSPKTNKPVVNAVQPAPHGTLWVAATPIGNLGDITQRLESVLHQCAFVACEDTRRTSHLLQHIGAQIPMIRMDEHATENNMAHCLDRLCAGESGLFVSDAGSPGIADPGSRLVAAAVAHNIAVVPLPGPSAVTAAISVSGFAGNSFLFAGFLPRKEGERKQFVDNLPNNTLVVVFLSPHRITDEMNWLAAIAPDDKVCLGREMTKLHESFYRGTMLELAQNNLPGKGEYVLVWLRCTTQDTESPHSVISHWITRLEIAGLAGRALVDLVTEITGQNKKMIYKQYLAHTNEEN